MSNNWLRATARVFSSMPPYLTVFCAVFFASLISMPVAAQDTPAPPSSSKDIQTPGADNRKGRPSSSIQIRNIVARPVPERTVGLEPGKVVRWTLKDAILAGLEKNVNIQLEQVKVRISQYNLIKAQGFYNPTTTSTILYNKSIFPNVARFTGAGGNTVNNDTLTYNFGVIKNFEWWGNTLSANFTNARSISNSSNLATSYSPALSFEFRQPLFKDFGIDQTRRNIKVTKRQMDLSDAEFRERVIQIILQVQQAYWDLSAAKQNEVVRRQSVELAETFLRNTKRQVELGSLAPIEVVSAATQLEQRRQDVFLAMNQVSIAENALKNLTANGTKDELWSSVIETVEPFDLKGAVIPVADAIRIAHENRPEIRQMDISEEINKIDIDFSRNQTKPQIDFVASYRTSGSAGTPAVDVRPNCSNSFPDPANPGQRVCAGIVPILQGNTLVPGVVTTPFDPAFSPPPSIADQFIGGYGTALGNMFKNEFRAWSVGIQFNFPLHNQAAKANLGIALEVERQRDLQERQLMQLIEVEVRNAVQAVETAKMRIDAAEAQTSYARQQLEGEEKKYTAGLQTTYFVLQRQNELSVALISELQAKVDYNKALANLQRVMATTLSSHSITLPENTPVKLK
jgi:outer membrane protein